MSNVERGTPDLSGTTSRGASGTNKGASTPAMSGGISGTNPQGVGEVKEQTATVAESAKNLASDAGEKLLNTVEEQKVAGADFARSVAGAIRRAANEFNEVPQATKYITLAADQIDSVADAFRKRDLNQLFADVQEFARRQPTAFLGATVLAGFTIVRFLKTSTGANAGSLAGRQQSWGAGAQGASGYQQPPRHTGDGRT